MHVQVNVTRQPAMEAIDRSFEARAKDLWEINQKIHSNPELGYKEFKAHDNITGLLERLGYQVTKHAHGLETSFVAEYGKGGRVVAFNAEYDALPGIGHACGHNLIATMSIGGFLAVAEALKKEGIAGRVRLIGTPAEEGLGGKIPIIDAGAYTDVDACLMTHPGPLSERPGYAGDAYMPTFANHKVTVTFTGKTAHAAMAPWEGVNALDAAVLAYSGIGVLRQQIHPNSRVHSIISNGGDRPNVIPGTASIDCYVRCPTLQMADDLLGRVKACFEGAAKQAACDIDIRSINTYADLRPNKALSAAYANEMAEIGVKVACDFDSAGVPGSTDQGNVSYECPSFQAFVGLETKPGCNNHTPGFTAIAGSEESHKLCLAASKGMARAAWRILAEDDLASQIRRDFEEDKKTRSQPVEGRVLSRNAGFC
ncbi:uncharacterized protein E0L32_000321 [Thyridium curvatum]|uniref:Peptidase M20 domain-containing protein 2 n=1 Tax=Thyridium curvatum TaxID=1093900 RepID=A0A507B844_9PEZI|nr:uncharacterized protein E0L32_000321 [Thyridium curvatum]TPX15987.1 hypothetical protein E0L32_000321 [Thyridium curvatum]